MAISISFKSFSGGPPPKEAIFKLEDGFTIGRMKDNDLEVYDPEKTASRYHARIKLRDKKYYIEDTSTPGTIINDSVKLRYGQEYELREGDDILIGDCEFCVVQIEIHNLLMDEHNSPMTVGYQNTKAPPIISNDTFSIDDFFTAFDESEVDISTHEPPYNAVQEITQTTASQRNTNISIDDLFQQSNNIEVNSSDIPRTILRKKETELSDVGIEARAIAAFLTELGMKPEQLVGTKKVEIMRVAGVVLKTLTQGMMDVLKAREEIKSQVGMERTQIRALKKNPLKVCSSPNDAMGVMFKSEEGYLDPIASAREAIDDANLHQIAMASGLSAVTENTTRIFDPRNLEGEFESKFVLGSRKAKYWELYKEKYENLIKNLRSESNNVFYDCFRESYENQIKKIKR